MAENMIALKQPLSAGQGLLFCICGILVAKRRIFSVA